ncbi:MAG: Ty3/Gypsy family RNase HI domain-containing protein, partial [bacterium]
MMAREILLTFPNFALPFELFTDASDTQLGAVIMQENKPIAFYSRKLTPTHKRYTVIERELLSIVETLREYRGVLYGFPLLIHTDHKNLTFKNFSSDRVNRWRLLMEDFNYEFYYLPGKDNIIADALSRFPMVPVNSKMIQDCMLAIQEPQPQV